MSIEYVDQGFELPEGFTPDLARWTILNRLTVPLLPEFKSIANQELLIEEQKINQSHTFVSRRLHPLAAKLRVSEMTFDTVDKVNGFFSLNSRRDDEFTYIDERTVNGVSRIVERIPLKFSFGGFHWRNPINLLIALSHEQSTRSPEFQSIGTEISQRFLSEVEIKELCRPMTLDVFKKSFKSLFTAMMKNSNSLYHRVVMEYQTSLFDEYGYGASFGINAYSGILYPKGSDDAINNIIKDVIQEYLSIQETTAKEREIKAAMGKTMPEKPVPWSKDFTTFRPNTNLEPLGPDEIDLHPEYPSEIGVYKVVYDDGLLSTDEVRLNPAVQPYNDGISYDPPLIRGVTIAQQPYKVVIANSKATIADATHDNHILRKLVSCDMMTRALDWAAANGLPLPPLGTEIFAHFADSTDAESLVKYQLPLLVYSRQRRHKFLAPFPDYSYGAFTYQTRFSINVDTVATWDSVRDYILGSAESKIPLNRRENAMFFRGAHYSHVGIRENLYALSGKRIADPETKKTLIPSGGLIVDVPSVRGVSFEIKPMSIPEMGHYRFLLDLPGYGMWSTRLKYICLTGSVVIRVMFVDIKYLPETKSWSHFDEANIWETFIDTFMPFDTVETLIGENYSHHKDVPVAVVNQLNRESRNRVITELGRIYQQYNKDLPKVSSITKRAIDTVAALTNDYISEYIYYLIMKMARMYGHIRNEVGIDDSEILE